MNKILIGFAVLSVILFCNCSSSSGPHPSEAGYSILTNQSGSTVSIAYLPYGRSERDSVVLHHSEGRYSRGAFYSYLYNTTVYIYYNGRYRVEAKGLTHGPLNMGDYIDTYIDGEVYRTFTFTWEDYNYAVEHGTDLEAAETQTPTQAEEEEW